MNDMLT